MQHTPASEPGKLALHSALQAPQDQLSCRSPMNNERPASVQTDFCICTALHLYCETSMPAIPLSLIHHIASGQHHVCGECP